MKILHILLFLLSTPILAQTSIQKSVITSKYGKLEFESNCNDKSQTIHFKSFQILDDEEIQNEALSKKIQTDKVIVKILTNKNGEIYKAEIIQKSILKSFNILIENYFREIIENNAARFNSCKPLN